MCGGRGEGIRGRRKTKRGGYKDLDLVMVHTPTQLHDLLMMAALVVAFLNLNFFSFLFRSSSTAHTFKFCAWICGGENGDR